MLDLASVAPGETLLDVGCGEGLIAFGALARDVGRVIFADVSADLLDLCRHAAEDLGVLDRCEFVRAPADDLAAVADASVDVVTTRSVLIYVRNKAAAFAEFFRVLRPGGRVSLFEPINRFAQRDAGFAGYDLRPLGELGTRLRAFYERLQPRDTDPMLDFDERDLVALAESAGFFPIHLYLDAVIEPIPPRAWEGFVQTAGNPNIPTIGEAMDQVLTPEERALLAAYLRPLVEEGRGTWRMASAHLVATKT